MNDLPITCTLGPEELRAQGAELLPGLVARAAEIRWLADGLVARFEAASGLLADAVRVIEAERKCCRFLRFRVTAEPELGPVWLEVTGPAGTRDFLAALTPPSFGV